MPAPLNLFEPQNSHFGPSWPSVSKTLGPLSPAKSNTAHGHAGRDISVVAALSTSRLLGRFFLLLQGLGQTLSASFKLLGDDVEVFKKGLR